MMITNGAEATIGGYGLKSEVSEERSGGVSRVYPNETNE